MKAKTANILAALFVVGGFLSGYAIERGAIEDSVADMLIAAAAIVICFLVNLRSKNQ